MKESKRQRAIAQAVALLQLNDYTVLPPQAPGDFQHETLGEVAARLRVCRATVSRRLAHPLCPAYEREEGESGRLITLRSNFSLEAWLGVLKGRAKRTL